MPQIRLLLFLTLNVFTMAAVPAVDAELRVQVAEIVGYGIFRSASSVAYKGFTRSAMASDTVRGVQFTEFTNTIPGKLGVDFGFEYIINSSPRGQPLRIRSIIRFPEVGLQKPGGRLYQESIENKEVLIGHRSLHGYGFDEPWEIVPGTWTFEIWHKDARIIRKTFTVVAIDEPDVDSSRKSGSH